MKRFLFLLLTILTLLFLSSCGGPGGTDPIDPTDPTTTTDPTDPTTTTDPTDPTTTTDPTFPLPIDPSDPTTTTDPTAPTENSISGTITAPTGVDVTTAGVAACLESDISDTGCANTLNASVDSSGAYVFSGLQAAPYAVIAGIDVDQSGTLNAGDYFGAYPQAVIPPITGINITLSPYDDGTTPPTGTLTGTWTGTTTTTTYGVEQITLALTESAGQVTGTLSVAGVEDIVAVTGSLSGNAVTLLSTFRLGDTGVTVDYNFSGTLSGTTLSGALTLTFSDSRPDDVGQFSVTKSSEANAPAINAEQADWLFRSTP